MQSINIIKRQWSALLPSAAAILTLVLSTASSTFAAGGGTFHGSATWKANPADGNWGSASNWNPATVPNGPADTATFANSNKRFLASEGDIEVNGVVFNRGASAFTIIELFNTMFITGVGITNNSGIMQTFAPGPGVIIFDHSATAGSLTLYDNRGSVLFGGTSTADYATFNNTGGTVNFFNSSTADHAIFNNNGEIVFAESSTADHATVNNTGLVTFREGTPTATAGNATFINNGGFIVFNLSAFIT